MTPCCFVAPSPWRSGGVGSPFCVPWSNGPDVLIEAAWPGQAVEDSNLTVQIAALRRALGEATPGGDRWIETMPRHGYRFIGPVVAEETPSPPIVKPKRNKAQLGKKRMLGTQSLPYDAISLRGGIQSHVRFRPQRDVRFTPESDIKCDIWNVR